MNRLQEIEKRLEDGGYYGAYGSKEIRYLLDLVKQQREALEFVKQWFARLEDDADPFDPLAMLRKEYHAPIHAKIDAALSSETGATE